MLALRVSLTSFVLTLLSAGVASAAVAITPGGASAAPRGSAVFAANGGAEPYAFTIVASPSGGAISSAGSYLAGPRGDVQDIVRVTDANNDSALAVVRVGPGVGIIPGGANLFPRASLDFEATGGSGTGYRWTLPDGAAGEIELGTGVYRALRASATDTITVTDSLGNVATVLVQIGGALTVAPTQATAAPNARVAFTADGGSDRYTWSLEPARSGGAIDPRTGAYTAGAIGDVVDVVVLRDSLGSSTTANVIVERGSAPAGPSSTVLPSTPEPAGTTPRGRTGPTGVNLAGGALADNACSFAGPARSSWLAILALALGAALFTRRRRIDEARGRVSIEELKGDELLGVRILVVDDEPETLELIAHTLRAAGAMVDEASGAARALELLAQQERHVDVVLSDLQMPDLDGFALMRALRDRSSPVVGVALSASSSPDDARRALEAGFSIHVTKPIAMVDLVETVRSVAPPPSLRRG